MHIWVFHAEPTPPWKRLHFMAQRLESFIISMSESPLSRTLLLTERSVTVPLHSHSNGFVLATKSATGYTFFYWQFIFSFFARQGKIIYENNNRISVQLGKEHHSNFTLQGLSSKGMSARHFLAGCTRSKLLKQSSDKTLKSTPGICWFKKNTNDLQCECTMFVGGGWWTPPRCPMWHQVFISAVRENVVFVCTGEMWFIS